MHCVHGLIGRARPIVTASLVPGAGLDGTEAINEIVNQTIATRNKGIRQRFTSLKHDAFLNSTEIRVWASSYNVNGSHPAPIHDLRSWLMHPGRAPAED
jgi:hypothetical protein